jgi:hypothetical protein
MFDEDKENDEEMGNEWDHHSHKGDMDMCFCSKKHKKEFKLAMLEKKEKMMEAKLEFIRKIKELMKKEATEPEEKK